MTWRYGTIVALTGFATLACGGADLFEVDRFSGFQRAILGPFAKPLENGSVEARTQRGHVILDSVDTFCTTLCDNVLAGYVQFLC